MDEQNVRGECWWGKFAVIGAIFCVAGAGPCGLWEEERGKKWCRKKQRESRAAGVATPGLAFLVQKVKKVSMKTETPSWLVVPNCSGAV